VTSYRLDELAARIGAEVVGDPTTTIRAVRPLEEAGPDDLSFLHNRKYAAQAASSRAGAILVADPAALPGRNLLVTAEPYLGLARALELLHPVLRPQPGVHASAVVAAGVEIGERVTVAANAVVGERTLIGRGTVIGAGSVIGCDVVIGDDCLLHPRVAVLDRCRVGDRCILQAGAVVGSDGYGFATVSGVHHKVPQVGVVVLEDDVELGANVCIDRATLGETRIGRGTKIDNLVQIAHNVRVGEGCLLVAQVGISGSTHLGHHVIMAGQSGAAGHLRIGDRVVVAAKTAVIKDVPDGGFVAGIPAQPHREWLRDGASLRRLPAVLERLRALETRVARLLGDGEGGE
jgi:UDP-3-O-[3-hydroxymyristoyl] glucosamine N-acyltransferase